MPQYKKTAGPVFCAGTDAPARFNESQSTVCVFSSTNESQATVGVASSTITISKTIAGGSGDCTAPQPINISLEHKISQSSVIPGLVMGIGNVGPNLRWQILYLHMETVYKKKIRKQEAANLIFAYI